MDRRILLKLLSAIGIASLIFKDSLARIITVDNDPEVCKKAWESLSDFNATRYQFRYIEPLKDLPNIFIYGDSISIGYTEYVRESLASKANVYRLHVNGGDSKSFIEKMETLRKVMFQPYLQKGWDFTWDVIHFNVGAHDLKYVYKGKLNKKEGIQVTSHEEYADNLKKIISYLKSTYSTAKLVFANTTPVPEGEPGRFKGDELNYNKIAMDVLKEHSEILINDLHAYSIPLLEKYAIEPGNVHFNEEGKRLQGIEVARVIGEILGIEPNPCPPISEVLRKFKEYEK